MKIIAGVDEVGRGSLIGPVYASAVILKKSINPKLLKDSKSLSKKDREYLCTYIKKNSTWSIGKASVKEIEKLNILQASLLAMIRAIKKLFYSSWHDSEKESLRREAELQIQVMSQPNQMEAVASAIENRSARFLDSII